MLFLLSFFFLFDQISSILSLKCLHNCKFQTFVNNVLPDLDTVRAAPTSCVIEEIKGTAPNAQDTAACSGHVKIEYPSNIFLFKLNGLKNGFLPGGSTSSSPWKIAPGKKLLIRSQTKGSFDQENFTLQFYIVCTTSDNCAWEILRQFYMDNTVAEAQIHGYKIIQNEFGNPPNTNPANLQCYEHVNQIVHCPAANEQCILSFYANGQNVKQGCHKINSNISSDFEFILTSNEDAVVNFQNTLPYHVEGEVLCSSNLCNSRERYNQLVARILSLYTQSSEFFNPPAITMQESETTLSTLTKQTVTSTRTTTTQSTTSIARRNQNPLNVPNSQSASSDAKRYINPSILIMIATFITLKIFP